MEKKEFVMALDAGTGAARCFLIALDGNVSYEAYEEWQYEYPPEAQPGGAQFDPQQFWGIFARLIQRALKENNITAEQIVGASSTSQREGIVLLDSSGRELYAGPNIDMRAPANFPQIAQVYGEEIYQVSGHWPFPMFAPYRLLWFREHRPDIYQKIDCMLMLNDWVLYRLSGEKVSEPSNATETLLYDIKHHRWADHLIRHLELPEHIFPPVMPSGTQIGVVTRSASAETGLLPGTPVISGGADTQCALLGTGSINQGQVSTVIGTFAPSQMVLDEPLIDPFYRSWSGCHVVPEKWVVESTAMEAGQSFRWVRDVFYAGGDTKKYSLMDLEASNSPIGSRGVMAFIGPRVPDYRCLKFDVRGGFFFNLPPAPGSYSRADFARAVLESIAYGIRANVERLQRITGVKVKTLSICGGISKSIAFRGILANVMNITVRIPQYKEGSALGAALCAAVGCKRVSNYGEAVEQLVRWEVEVEPSADRVEAYEALYRQWLSFLPVVHGTIGLGEIV